MSRVKVYLLVVLMAFIMAALSSCGDDDDGGDPPQQSAVDLVIADDRFSTLETALTTAGLVDDLQGDGPFTIFAPTNAAFEAFIAGDTRFASIQELLDNSDVLTAVLQYHVVSGENFASALTDGTTLTTLQTEEIAVTRDNNGGVVLNGSVSVTGADNDVSNGVVHIIDQVLLPPSLEPEEQQNIVQLATANNLTTLVAALGAANLTETFEGEGNFTVFAPTDDAFQAFIEADGRFATINDLIAADGGNVLTQVLQYHVLNTENFAADLADNEATLLDGQSITIERDGDGNVTIDGNSDVIMANVDASNGVVHVIDRVLIPEPLRIGSIVDVATAEVEGSNSQLDSLVVALSRFPDLLEVLGGEGTLTVFAPTNEAFRGLLDAVGLPTIAQLNGNVLRNVLEFHVVSTAGLRASQLQDNSNVETVAGEEVTITTGGGVTITTSANDASVIANGADVAANNGVVHIIDEVLIPELAGNILGSVLEPVYFDADFSILTTALEQEELLDDLYNGSDLTLFAPDDAAFEAFLADDTNDFSTAEELLGFDGLDGVLLYHVLGAKVLSSALPATGANPLYLATLLPGPAESTSVDLQIKEGATLTGDVQIDITRVDEETGNNSVVHVLQGVLLPPTIVDLAVGDGRFTELADALGTAGLVTTLSDTGPFTVFAPTDDAFGAITPPTDPQELENVLRYHVTNGNVLTDNLNSGDNTVNTLLDDGGVQTFVLNGTSLTITGTSNTTSVNVIITDIQGTNGVIHVVDQVLLP